MARTTLEQINTRSHQQRRQEYHEKSEIVKKRKQAKGNLGKKKKRLTAINGYADQQQKRLEEETSHA